MKAVLKRRARKEYRIREIDTKIRASRTRNEARIMAMASRSGISAPKLLLSQGFDIYMGFVEGERLDSLVERKAGPEIFGPVGSLLGRLHRINIAHGDYTPANIVVRDGSPCIIDFGLAQVTGTAESKALDLLLMKRSIGRIQYRRLVSGYRDGFSGAGEVLKRLEVIERRGRYQKRTLQ
jgi:Kae1-associated kinase Bud32